MIAEAIAGGMLGAIIVFGAFVLVSWFLWVTSTDGHWH